MFCNLQQALLYLLIHLIHLYFYYTSKPAYSQDLSAFYFDIFRKFLLLIFGCIDFFSNTYYNTIELNREVCIMADFVPVSCESLDENTFSLIGRDWMLVTAGDSSSFNTMTASWGGLGVLWSDPVAFIFVRPQRYTFGFTEKNDFFTLSFFDEKYRGALSLCGTKSGRDCDKVRETGLTPVHEDGYTYFAEAKLVIVCRKLYAQDIRPECFTDRDIIGAHYPANDFHRMYTGKIIKCLKKA